MKFLGVIFALCIGCLNTAYAKQEGFALQYVKPINIKIFSSGDGISKQETFSCTPQTCCFSERFYCLMENGRCICDLHRCGEKFDAKSYWMELSGTEAERYCGRPRLLHELTQLCICDPDKSSPCDECNAPSQESGSNPMEGISLPPDCRPY